ncbi:MAG: zinc ABC transporter substrate-binding protein [Clostridia bacterium]|nr:zinc ABC transporter substrate-binding protein [Clostridia bacterium]
MILIFLLTACAPAQTAGKTRLTISATTYPVYLFATAITEGVDGIEVKQVVNQPTACLHDYTLSVNDMKALEGADVVALSGAGLEDFLTSALGQTEAQVIDCSKGLTLHAADEHEEEHAGHDHGDEEGDPHIWMDPNNAVHMLGNLAEALKELDPDNADTYETNYLAAKDAVNESYRDNLAKLTGLLDRNLITFHDGFHYFADAFHLTVLKAIEEEEGAETSAKEINEIVSLVEEYRIPAIFTEVNGSDATAKAIARETGVAVYPLSMIMSGDGTGVQPYLDAITANVDTILEAMSA